MKTFRIIVLAALLGPFVQGCAELMNIATQVTQEQGGSNPLSGNEVIEGLKTALLVGTDTSVTLTSRLDGFYKDEVIKILLPPEAQKIYENKDKAIFKAVGLDKKLEDAVMALNRAAEDASKEAGPIFKSAITNLSIRDGWSILKGKNPANASQQAAFDSTAATAYLRSTTYSQLSAAYSPKVNASLDKKLVGNYSPNQIWNTLTSSYNTVANNSFGRIEPIATTDLGTYVTEKALDGLFYKVSLQEKDIRKDPMKWAKTAVGNILQRVFGNS
ncbi:MAG: DUF4197 domain-containing protein [Bacteroidales bacterium]|nr:DUF4197 domain-containing protein [Bacteroidales bacterium]MCB9013239.1 DUF4197 domain-containing protein [Bacteroidales bacterium]